MFYLSVKDHFDAAHHLENYEGKCANIHGHTWDVEVVIAGDKLDGTGMLLDFSILKKLLKTRLDEFDHKYINNHEVFSNGKLNPTAENLSKYIFETMHEELKAINKEVALKNVKVWESPLACAIYSAD